MSDKEDSADIQEINELQRGYFNSNVDIFEPPLPEGVPEKLRRIVKAGEIEPGERVLDVGTGVGALIEYILPYRPSEIYANDLAENMLDRVKAKFPDAITLQGDIAQLALSDRTLDVVFINGCFSNIMDKQGALKNIRRMVREGGRLVISHPLGRRFIEELKHCAPFPLDSLPDREEALNLFLAGDFSLKEFVDERDFYLLVGVAPKAPKRGK